MKKYFLIILFLICLTINTIYASNAQACHNIVYPSNLNSQNILVYLKENNLNQVLKEICSFDICLTIEPANLERDINTFITKNYQYLQNKVDENTLLTLKLKGFKITKIITNEC